MTLDQLPPRYREQALRKLGLIPDATQGQVDKPLKDKAPRSTQPTRRLPPTSRKIGSGQLLKPAGKDDASPSSRKTRRTLMPDAASSIVRDVTASRDEVRIVLSVNPQEIPTAQQKGVFVGRDGRVHFFTKAKIAKAAKTLVHALSPHSVHSASWGNVPIGVSIDFFFPFPSGTPKRDLHTFSPHLNRPDVDNCCKLILDCLTDSGMWKDDSLICDFLARKRRTTLQPSIVITIENLKPRFDRLFRDSDSLDSMPLFLHQNNLDTNQTSQSLDQLLNPLPNHLPLTTTPHSSLTTSNLLSPTSDILTKSSTLNSTTTTLS